MTIPLYLAMTAEEYAFCEEKPAHLAWMACHFSPYCTGITNLPPVLPEDAMVILNDRTPIHGHDPEKICNQLKGIHCSSILLDFQRPNITETEKLVSSITKGLSIPVGVSEIYAKDLDCPVFLPPVPPNIPIEQYLHPYIGQEIWLEAGLSESTIHVTETGATITCSDMHTDTECPHSDEVLCCGYTIEIGQKEVVFTLRRRKTDLEMLLEDAEKLGVTRAVGLYQELK